MREAISKSMSVAALTAAALFAVPGQGLAATGGPDDGGYIFFDQDDGCDLDFIDLSSDPLATALVGNCDECFGRTPLPTPVSWYGVDRNFLTVSENGFVTLQNWTGTNDWQPACPIPRTHAAGPQDRIMVNHGDGDLRPNNGTVYYRHFDVCPRAPAMPCDVVHWHRLDYWNNNGTDIDVNFILYADGQIVGQKIGFEEGTEPLTIGMQQNPTVGLSLACNGSWPSDSAICYVQSCEGRPAGSACSDGNPCTFDDACNADGACVPGGFLEDGESCGLDDGNACTELPVCQGGTCVTENTPDGSDCSDGNQCTEESCNEGACVAADLPTGTPCDDGNQCSDGTCDSGACVSNSVADGTPCIADANICTDDFCEGGACVTADAPDGTPCGLVGACDDSSTCESGTCQTEALDCSFFDSQCEAGACDPFTGDCGAIALTGPGCDDGNPCTTGDACDTGSCEGIPVDCSFLDTECTVGVCDPTTGGCRAVPVANGTTCDAANTCAKSACQNGTCQILDAFDGIPCAGAVCNISECSGGACTAVGPIDCGQTECFNAVCDAFFGGCFPMGPVGGGTPCTPSDVNNPCIVSAACDGLGNCVDAFVADGTPCDDGAECTTGDQCTAGVCGGAPVADGTVCDDNNVCTSGEQCDAGVCRGSANTQSCDDNSPCTTGDTCMNGNCAGVPTVCPDTNVCNVGICDAATGNCSTVPASAGTPCDDGDPCTDNDGCFGGACVGRAKECALKGTVCGAPVCDSSTGDCSLDPINEGGQCDDGDPCTTGDSCGGGTCSGTARDCSNLTDTCNTGVCDAVTGQCRRVPLADGTGCDDGIACTGGDACRGGICLGTENLCAAQLNFTNGSTDGRTPGLVKKNCANTGAQPWALAAILGLLILRRRRSRR